MFFLFPVNLYRIEQLSERERERENFGILITRKMGDFQSGQRRYYTVSTDMQPRPSLTKCPFDFRSRGYKSDIG